MQLNLKGEERERWGEEGVRGSRLIGEGLKRGMLPTDFHGLMGKVVSGGLCYSFQVLRCRVIQQEEGERGSRLLKTDFHR